MTKQPQTMRTCTVCGQKKPLLAFLELAGDKGHTYGDICSTCRGAGLGRKKAGESESVDKSGDSSRLQIDVKARLQFEREKKEQFEQSTDLEHKEKIKKESTEAEKSSESTLQHEVERKQREAYLEQKKQGPATKAGQKNTQQANQTQTEQSQGFYQEKARGTKEFFTRSLEQQLGKKTSDISPNYVSRYISSTGRSAESLFGLSLGQFLRDHLKKSFTGGAKEQAQQKSEVNLREPAASKEEAKQLGKTEGKENLATEFIKNNFSNKR